MSAIWDKGLQEILIKQAQVTHIVLADLYPDPARLSPKLRESEKTTLIKMDVNDHAAMVKAFQEVDVVINTAGPFYKTAVPVAKAAVAAKVNYIDICDDYERKYFSIPKSIKWRKMPVLPF